jgi:putative heme iron utilization protein
MATMQEPDIYEEARALLSGARSGSLAVIEAGMPVIALVTPAIGPDGAPLVLLSTLSAHTRALAADPRCALMVASQPAAGAPGEENPQTSARLSLTGRARPIANPNSRAAYLAIHPYAELYIDFADFSLWRIQVESARFVGGFARAASLDPARLLRP